MPVAAVSCLSDENRLLAFYRAMTPVRRRALLSLARHYARGDAAAPPPPLEAPRDLHRLPAGTQRRARARLR